jgi:chromosome segregation ATPase
MSSAVPSTALTPYDGRAMPDTTDACIAATRQASPATGVACPVPEVPMATTLRLAGVAAAATMFGSLLMPATASATPLSERPTMVRLAGDHADCGHHRGGVAALRREAADLGAQRTTVAAELADAENEVAAATARVDALQTQVSALQQQERDVLTALNITGLIERAINFREGLISTLPDGPEKDRLLAEQEAARAANHAHRDALALELADVRQRLATTTAALGAAQQTVVAVTATVAAETQQLAAIDARLAAIAVELSHGRCDRPRA